MNDRPAAAAKAAREPRYYFEDFPPGQVREYGSLEVTREAVLAFAADFDPQPFHLDDDAAAASLFGRLAASGWHTCAMTMRILCDGYLLDSASLGSPGIDKLRWVKPVYPGDTLSVRVEVMEARPMASKPELGLVRSTTQALNQHRDVVLTMEGWGIFRRRARLGDATTSADGQAPDASGGDASAGSAVPASTTDADTRAGSTGT
ncbi:MaoC/PaaZ C-terminal domain-containing protein [Piscinibacter koreensis]|uniref:MaoC family dehydratase n=1 Tax=Piscinibacter koreensis TaxID=2742824 RepID=A0A7Y6NJR9_9BURK|nr:MaoC family dehydratase [Schlegelella koreensis]